MPALSVEISIGMTLAVVVSGLLLAEVIKRARRKRRLLLNRESERRKHWGYI